MDELNDLRREILHKFMQKVSYDVGDLIMRVPRSIRPAAVAVLQACVSAEVATMPDADRDLYDATIEQIKVVTLPTEMDPRNNK